MQYTLARPSPHSLNTIEVTWYGNWTVCSWVGESGGKNNARNANDKTPSWGHDPPAGYVTRFTRGRVRELKYGHNSVTVQNRTHVYMNFLITKTYEITSCSNVHKSWNTLYIYIYIHTYIHLIWIYVQRNVATLDSVILQHLSEIIYAVMYSCRRFIGQRWTLKSRNSE